MEHFRPLLSSKRRRFGGWRAAQRSMHRKVGIAKMDEMSKNSSPEEEEGMAIGSGDETDVSPSAIEDQIPESGTSDFPEQWIDKKCVFCLQELKDVNEPQLLQCLHTACKSCLNLESAPSLPSSTSNGSSAKQCPQCNQEIVLSEIVDHLFVLEHLSQNAEGLPEESKSYPCSCDEGADATGFCTDCQEWLCDTCVTAHHRVRITKDHLIRSKEEMEGEKTSSLTQKYMFCPAHSLEPLKLYCESCDKLTCRDCQLSDHKDHKYQFLSKACEEEKLHLSQLLIKIKEKQGHIDNACELVNKRHREITDREMEVTREIKTFAVKYITEINRRGKQLLQELSEVCNSKKSQLSQKHQELIQMAKKLKYCRDFSENALMHGSETAMVYSKKAILGQLRRILKHRCEVPNPQHNVDISFTCEGTFLQQCIAQAGSLYVDQRPIPTVTSTSGQQMLPRPQQQQQIMPPSHSQALVPRNTSRQMVPVNRNAMMMQQQQQQMQMHHNQQQQRGPPQKQQQNQMQQRVQVQKQPQSAQQLYGQPQVTSSTDPAQNRNMQGGMRPAPNNQIVTYSRNPVQRNHQSNVSQSQNAYIPQRHAPAQPQPSPQRQPPAQPSFNPTASIPVPLIQNSNLTISPINPGHTPPKQRVIAPRQVQPTQSSPQRHTQQPMPQHQQPQISSQPQLIVIDDGTSKTPNMSNTARLSHFPAEIAALSSKPGLQIQPINYNPPSKF